MAASPTFGEAAFFLAFTYELNRHLSGIYQALIRLRGLARAGRPRVEGGWTPG